MNDAVDFSEGEGLVDLSGVEEAKFELLPKGNYNVVVTDVEFTHSQSSGNPMWPLTMEVSDGEYAGRKLFTFITFSERALPFAKRTLGRIAPQLLEGPFNPQDPDVYNQLLNLELVAQVVVKKVDGEDRNNVRDVFLQEDEF